MTKLPDQAVLHYDAADFDIVEMGSFVLCAVSGRKIALEDLTYWSAAHQEAYYSATEATAAMMAGGAANIAAQ